tara:strand:- start:1628 stop:2314 length:687 start_codon:yes stop_codon:yes gene_type:complete
MIKDKLVAKTIYISLIAQFITTSISLHGLFYDLKPEDEIMKDILILEAIVQFIEALFYIWVILALKNLKIMTPRRYIDWFITTPTMLVSTIIFMEYRRKKESGEDKLEFWSFMTDHKDNIIKLVLLNFLMLFFGYLGEIEVLEKNLSVVLGFIFFILAFHLIYDKYAKHTTIGTNLFIFLVSVWSLYGIAALMNLKVKNTMYNLLDIVSKNFYGLFIYYYIRQIGTLS